MMIDPWLPNEPFVFAIQARSEYSTDFDDLSRIGARVLFDTSTRFGIDTEANYWSEQLATGGHDQLWTGDMNLVFRFAQSDWLQMRTGLARTGLVMTRAKTGVSTLRTGEICFPPTRGSCPRNLTSVRSGTALWSTVV